MNTEKPNELYSAKYAYSFTKANLKYLYDDERYNIILCVIHHIDGEQYSCEESYNQVIKMITG